MKLKSWYKIRGPKFIWQRGTRLLERYGLLPEKAIDRIKSCTAEMVALGCAPTFFTPGILVQRYPKFIRSLQEAGAEIAVHGYHHINLRDLPVADAVHQLLRAVQTFERFGIEVHGFRCPYMGSSDELQDNIPAGVFEYSSNQSIDWGDVKENDHQEKSLFFDTLNRLYNAKDSSQKIGLPWTRSNMVEIPVCVPDDLQLYDGLLFDNTRIANTWERILHQTHQRGELFTLIFHTELAALWNSPFGALIRRSRGYQPEVWIARLQDINDWWREKSIFKVDITPVTTGLRLNFSCTPRATILARGLDTIGSMPIWDGNYHRLPSNMLEVSTNPRPFVGLASDVPGCTVSFLREHGYIMDTGETAGQCGIYLDAAHVAELNNELQLINYIETSAAPLVKFWRWPNGARSALCITGDLDALSLLDYASRIFI